MTTKIKIEDILPLLTGRTPQSINRLLSYFLKADDIPLTREQWSIMAVLWEKEGRSQQVLADATYRDRPGITRLIDNLEKEKLVMRKPDPEDRRSNLIFLTSKGKKLEAAVRNALIQTVEVATKDISEEHLQIMRTIFHQINQNIQSFHSNQE